MTKWMPNSNSTPQNYVKNTLSIYEKPVFKPKIIKNVDAGSEYVLTGRWLNAKRPFPALHELLYSFLSVGPQITHFHFKLKK